jgi:hypothetical protein
VFPVPAVSRLFHVNRGRVGTRPGGRGAQAGRGEARAQARAALATTRGLLLDLLATGDRHGVEQAVEVVIAGYCHGAGSGENRVAKSTSGSDPGTTARDGRPD